jgi:hypothetical protein
MTRADGIENLPIGFIILGCLFTALTPGGGVRDTSLVAGDSKTTSSKIVLVSEAWLQCVLEEYLQPNLCCTGEVTAPYLVGRRYPDRLGYDCQARNS